MVRSTKSPLQTWEGELGDLADWLWEIPTGLGEAEWWGPSGRKCTKEGFKIYTDLQIKGWEKTTYRSKREHSRDMGEEGWVGMWTSPMSLSVLLRRREAIVCF